WRTLNQPSAARALSSSRLIDSPVSPATASGSCSRGRSIRRSRSPNTTPGPDWLLSYSLSTASRSIIPPPSRWECRVEAAPWAGAIPITGPRGRGPGGPEPLTAQAQVARARGPRTRRLGRDEPRDGTADGEKVGPAADRVPELVRGEAPDERHHPRQPGGKRAHVHARRLPRRL